MLALALAVAPGVADCRMVRVALWDSILGDWPQPHDSLVFQRDTASRSRYDFHADTVLDQEAVAYRRVAFPDAQIPLTISKGKAAQRRRPSNNWSLFCLLQHLAPKRVDRGEIVN